MKKLLSAQNQSRDWIELCMIILTLLYHRILIKLKVHSVTSLRGQCFADETSIEDPAVYNVDALLQDEGGSSAQICFTLLLRLRERSEFFYGHAPANRENRGKHNRNVEIKQREKRNNKLFTRKIYVNHL